MSNIELTTPMNSMAQQAVPNGIGHNEFARAQLTSMLGMPHVGDNIKAAIYAALVEDRAKQLKNGGKTLRQRELTLFGDENDPIRYGQGR